MSKLTIKIAVPIILVGVFAMITWISMDYDQLGVGFYFVISFLAIFVFFSGLAAGQHFSSPIKKILDKATDLSNGDLSARINLETKDELAELARVLNKIAVELEASREQTANAELALGIKVKARTHELEETINALEQKVKNRTIELERLMEKFNKKV